ncbi:MAG TPA: PaaI family thioesterase [Kofleriaceae bacterium]|jgi:uncharacterized protein (TIGR00369 family)|nr:PaaI family thioesterase [Kofleriaceae bacterium]
MTGLEHLRAILDGRVPRAPIQATLDFDLTEADEGRARFTGRPSAQHANPMGTVHGGYAATLLDSAMGSAVMTTLAAGESYGTVDLIVHLVRPITPASGPLVADATIVHRGKTIATAEGRLTDGNGKLVAHATTTCVITRA